MRKPTLRGPLGLAAVILTLPGFAAAQAPDSIRSDTLNSFSDSFLMTEIRVLARQRLTATGGVGAIEMRLDSLGSVPVPTLEQALREMPFVRIRENSRGEAQPSLRGATDRQIAVLVDGVPLTLGWDHRTDLSIIPLTAARSVNLLRGLSSVLHGPNVLAGVVEVDVARGNERMESPPPATFSLGMDQTGGVTVGATGARMADSDGGQWLVQAGTAFRDRSGTTLPDADDLSAAERALLSQDGDLRLNSDFRHVDGFVSARYQGYEGAWGSMMLSGFDVARGVPPETNEAEPRLWRYPDQSRFVAAFSGGTGDRETAWGVGDLEASLGVDVGSFRIQQFNSAEYDTVIDEEEGDDRTLTLRLLGDHTISHRADVRAAFTYGDVSHSERLTGQDQNDFRQRLWSLGAEAEWRGDDLPGWGSLGATRVNVGFAVDGADTPGSADKPPLGRLWDWGARLGFSSLTANSMMLFHGGVSRRARFPSLRELYSDALGRFLANPGLTPEILTGAEMGLTWDLPVFDLQVVGFHQVLSDGIVRIAVDTPEGARRQRVNRDRIRSTGIEVVATGALGSVEYAGDVTFQQAWQFDEGNDERTRPEYEPNMAARLSLGVPVASAVTLSAEYRYVGSQFCLNTDGGGLDPLDTTHRMDLQLRRLFRLDGRRTFANLDGLISLANVMDRAIFDQCGLPQPGRTLRFQVRLF
jgi:iron complex outermembrane receptor protein